MLPLLLLASLADARTVFLTSSTPTSALPSCLQNSYHGVYGGQHLFLPSDECTDSLASLAAQSLDDGVIVPFDVPSGAREIVWVGHAGVRGALRTREVLEAAMGQIASASAALDVRRAAMQASENAWIHSGARKRARRDMNGDGKQVVFSDEQDATTAVDSMDIEDIYTSEQGMFLSVPRPLLPLMDTFLPPGLVPVGVPASPVPLAYDVPEHYAKHLAEITRNLRFDPDIATVVNTLSAAAVRKDVRYLTGEDSDIVTRHSFTEGARVAAKWIKNKMEATGAQCEYFSYLAGFSPDVICTYPSLTNSTEHVILSGHYDSRGSFGNVRAPGGDDDGSGSGHVLAVANAIAQHNITFEKSLSLVFFSGEEQGLWGSHYYAKHLKESNATVILQIQADMLAYRVPGEPMQLGLPETIELPEAGYLVSNLSALYAPELVVGRTAACCSDHQSFLSYGYPSTQVFERNGWIADPMYHNSGDLSDREGYDFEQIVSIAKVTMSAVLAVAGYKLPQDLE